MPWKFAFAFECLLPPAGSDAWKARFHPVPAGIGQGYVGESCADRLWEFGDDVRTWGWSQICCEIQELAVNSPFGGTMGMYGESSIQRL